MAAEEVDNIFLEPQYMYDLFFLCAHDFKHDFVEDKERSGRAFGRYGFGGGQTTTDEKKGSSNKIEEPEDFPLICYAYLIWKKGRDDGKYDFDFDELCNGLGEFGKKFLEGSISTESISNKDLKNIYENKGNIVNEEKKEYTLFDDI